jgi:HAD superfamily hydrolase (TIGR01458 family)
MIKIPLLIDFDGVLRIGNKPAEGIKNFLDFIIEEEIPSYIISNSTLKTSSDLISFFNSNDIELKIPAMTAAEITFEFVKSKYKSVAVYCVEPIKKLFTEFIDFKNPEAVVVGDNGENWGYKMMNEIFNFVNEGADLIAMQKNKFWYPDGKTPKLDAGSFIKAIEYATGKEAKLIGKPSPIYFRTALNRLGFKDGHEFLMLGDDIESDIEGAKNSGGKAILIYTGKTKYPFFSESKTKPDFEAMDLNGVQKVLEKFYKD